MVYSLRRFVKFQMLQRMLNSEVILHLCLKIFSLLVKVVSVGIFYLDERDMFIPDAPIIPIYQLLQV